MNVPPDQPPKGALLIHYQAVASDPSDPGVLYPKFFPYSYLLIVFYFLFNILAKNNPLTT